MGEALRQGKLAEFVHRAEAAGVGPVSLVDFENCLGSFTKPQPEDETSHLREK